MLIVWNIVIDPEKCQKGGDTEMIQQETRDVFETEQASEEVVQPGAGACPATTAVRPLTRTEQRTLWMNAYSEQDIALQMWVHLVEQQNLDLAMMLQVHGLLIFGTMVSTSSYVQFYIAMNEEMLREIDPEAADLLNAYCYTLLPPCACTQQSEIGPAGLPVIQHYIHLRDATIMSAEHKIKVPFWRGKISQVDAFVMGATAAE